MMREGTLTLLLLFSGSAALLYRHELLPATPAATAAESSAGYALALPVLFVLAVNLYLVLFRFQAFLRVLRLVVLTSAYLSYALVLLLIISLLEALFSWPGLLLFPMLLILLLLPLVPVPRIRPWIRNLQLASFAGIAGATLSSYLNLTTLVLSLGLLALLDYHYVVRRRAIPRLISKLESADVPLGVEAGRGEDRLVLGLGDLLFASALAAASYAELGLVWGIAALFAAAASLLVLLRLVLAGARDTSPALPAVFAAALLVWLLAEVCSLFGGF